VTDVLVIKRNGKRVSYDKNKIAFAIGKAMMETGDVDTHII